MNAHHHLFGLPTWIPISLLGILSWTAWLVRQYVGAGYRPLQNEHHETTSMVVPVYREDIEVLKTCLDTWLKNGPNEIILVIDVTETEIIEQRALRLWRIANHPTCPLGVRGIPPISERTPRNQRC